MTEPTVPNETLQSQLSAFIDGELPTAETELLARRLARDAELQQTLSRYILLGEALRAPRQAGGVSKEFSARIAAAIEQTEVKTDSADVHVARKRVNIPWQLLKPAAGIAVAASVALVAVLVVRNPQSPADSVLAQRLKDSSNTQLAAQVSNGDSYVVPAVATAPSAPIPAARLTNYVVAHSEFTSPLGQRNMLMGLLSDDQTSEVSSAANEADQPAVKNENKAAGQ